MRRLLVLTAALLVIPTSAWAGGGGHMSVCAGFATGSVVSMLDSCFEGTAHFAPAGETITIVNDGSLPHTFTAVDGSFDTGQLESGERREITVEEPGVIEVFCTLHGTAEGAGMAGVLVVGEPEPLPVSAPANMAVIRDAVAEESGALAEALSNQSQMISALTTAQVKLTEAVEAHADQEGEDAEAAATGLSPSGTEETASPWAATAIGAAGGILVSGLLFSLLIRRRLGAPGIGRRSVEAEPGSAM